LDENPVGLASKALKAPRALSMAYGMLTRARQTRAEDGFILIEVLVSAVILAIVAGAVLTLIAATTRSAASSRNHSVAYGLAQENQAQLRTLQISKLNRYAHDETVEIGGTKYTIESRGVFVNDKTGTGSCSSSDDSADYVEITSTVSSPTLLHPVALQSIVAPSSGSLDPSHGTIAFQINNATEGGVAGISLTGSGTANFSGSSDSNGCAVFTDLPYGNYTVTATGNGLITPEGSETWSEKVGAPAHGTAQVPISFDRPGAIEQEFVYKEPTAGEMKPAPVDSMELFQSENGNKTITYGTPNLRSRSATQIDERVYPFQTKYKVYAGSCTSNDPDPANKGINAAAVAHAEVTAGHVATPPPIQIPALNLAVTDSSGKVVQGATVILTDTTCTYNSKKVKREFTTNKVGHIVNSGETELGTTTQAVGLPFGTYEICVSATISGQTRRAEATGSNTVTVNNLSSAATKSLKLGTTSSAECK
jgi:type II secretory pathway pseudopilin PulG